MDLIPIFHLYYILLYTQYNHIELKNHDTDSNFLLDPDVSNRAALSLASSKRSSRE